MSTSALQTVADYIAEARILLQDTVATYRYSDASLVASLNLALQETRRLRPDLFVFSKEKPQVPYYTDAESGQTVPIEEHFRQAVLNGLVGYAIERDQEDIEDARATMFINLMRYMLTGEKPRSQQPRVVAQAAGGGGE